MKVEFLSGFMDFDLRRHGDVLFEVAMNQKIILCPT
jgi:hypothetical protein